MAFFQGIKDYLGIGRGKIDVQLKRLQYSQGETIEGTLVLTLSKPVSAEGVSVQLMCDQTTTGYVNDARGRHAERRSSRVFDFTQPLDSEKTYPAGPITYPFQIKIPTGMFATPQTPPGFLGTLEKFAQASDRNTISREWLVIGRLSIKGLDTVKRVGVNIV